VEVREPHLLKIQRDLDFGRGFYTTSDFDQAKSWAQRTTRIRGTGKPLISCYEVNEADFAKLKIRRFKTADKDWLDFITDNRKGSASADDWDLIIGPVANDQTFPTILLYLDGFIDAENAINRLLTQRLKDQYTFKTEAAIALLRCTKVKPV
jgi:hypothetical protein